MASISNRLHSARPPQQLPRLSVQWRNAATQPTIRVSPGQEFDVLLPANRQGGKWKVSPDSLKNVKVVSSKVVHVGPMIGRGGVKIPAADLTLITLRAAKGATSGSLDFLDISSKKIGRGGRPLDSVDAQLSFPLEVSSPK